MNNHRFLDYEVYHDIKSQARRDFQEGSGNKCMLEADGFLKAATDSFNLAGAHLKDTEGELLRLLDRLEAWRERMGVEPTEDT